MDKQQLHQLLEQLHTALSQTASLDDDERALLQSLQADVQALLKRSGDPASQTAAQGSLLASLRTSVQQFEVAHPDLTRAMIQVIDTLSGAGV